MNRIDVTKLPTPVDKYKDYNKNQIFIKRDDLTDLLLGGNKARKIEYFIADALEKGANILMTYGSAQSNHCRITAAIANRVGLKCVLIMPKEEQISFNGNFFLLHLLGAEIVWCSLTDVADTIMRIKDKYLKNGNNPYFIAGGDMET